MKNQLIALLVQLLVNTLNPELLKKFADMALDFVENFVLGTKSSIDDALVLPICKQIRTAFDVPDNDVEE